MGLAQLREVACRGKTSASLIYDTQPIMDYFRKVTKDIVLGLGDVKGKPLDFSFTLHATSTTEPDPPQARGECRGSPPAADSGWWQSGQRGSHSKRTRAIVRRMVAKESTKCRSGRARERTGVTRPSGRGGKAASRSATRKA